MLKMNETNRYATTLIKIKRELFPCVFLSIGSWLLWERFGCRLHILQICETQFRCFGHRYIRGVVVELQHDYFILNLIMKFIEVGSTIKNFVENILFTRRSCVRYPDFGTYVVVVMCYLGSSAYLANGLLK